MASIALMHIVNGIPGTVNVRPYIVVDEVLRIELS